MVCRSQLVELAEKHDEFRKLDATLVAVSSDAAADLAEWAADEGIPFALASDTDLRAIEAWGVREEDEGRSVPAVFVVDRNGTIRFAQVGESVTDRAEVDDLLTALTAR